MTDLDKLVREAVDDALDETYSPGPQNVNVLARAVARHAAEAALEMAIREVDEESIPRDVSRGGALTREVLVGRQKWLDDGATEEEAIAFEHGDRIAARLRALKTGEGE